MHFHYYTLRSLATWLNQNHQGEKIHNCFSQSRNELVIELENISLRIGCHTPETYLVPVNEFAKARKNVVDLFEEIIGLKFTHIRVLPFEREMIMELENGVDLVFKLHNINANVLIRENGVVQRMFNNKLEEDWEYEEIAGTYNEAGIDQEVAQDFDLVSQALRSISPIFSKPFALRVMDLMKSGKSFKDAFSQLVKESEDNYFFIRKSRTNIKFSLFDSSEEDQVRVNGVGEALLLYLKASFQYKGYMINYREVEKVLDRPFKKYKKVYTSYKNNITKLEKDRNPEEYGHLLMANLHAIQPHLSSVELDDFYTGSKVKIKLDPKLSPQDNAEKYYKKHKQRKGKISYLKSQLDDIKEKWEAANEKMEAFRAVPSPESLELTERGFDVKKLRELKKFAKYTTKKESQGAEKRYPFRTYHKEGFDIFVGKGGKNNDELSFKFASKEDLWLHVKDVPGSHVIIRHRAGKNIPITVLEYAAGLAAYYSKKKNDTLVPVQYTTRKYIRKRKGDPPGLVVVDREEVIMIEPSR